MFNRFVIFGLVCCFAQSASNALGYGKRGHATVGAIADQRLASKPVATQIAKLLDGMTLERAALLPDEIKAWDFGSRQRFRLPEHPAIEDQLFAFFDANRPNKKTNPSHHQFHFCDVPIVGDEKYADGKVGRNEFDVVKMIPFCIDVLKGNTPEDNERKITKSVAVILLAHLVGDIHQPLHVGAQYFDADGKPTNPDKNGDSFADHGGGTLQLILSRLGHHGHKTSTKQFHSYWDDDTVDTAYGIIQDEILADREDKKGQITDGDVIRRLAALEPQGWSKSTAKMPAEKWSEAWANDILPAAREAHNRLEFRSIVITADKKSKEKLAHGQAVERMDQDVSYHDWAGQTVRDQLHKGGWRLAALLEKILE